MDAGISIKIKGLQAIDALNRGQLLGGVKIQGVNALLGMRGMEANGALMNKGLLMREVEIEGNRMMLMQPSQGAGAVKAPALSAVAPKSAAAMTKGAGAAATTKSVGVAALSTKGWGYGLWLGGFGPWLVLGSLGLAATGVYFYLRAQRLILEAGVPEADEP
jgi:hypothetical protein